MAYKARNDHTGVIHHVTNRGARRTSTFDDDTDRRYFCSLLGRLPSESRVEVLAYCLMGNHFHLLLRNSGGSLSDGMHLLGVRYVKRFNWRHGYDGPLFKARFFSSPVNSDAYLMTASRYVHQNPSELGYADRLAEYPWSSYAAYLGVVPRPVWLNADPVLDLFGDDAQRYGRFVESDLGTGPMPPAPQMVHLERAARAWVQASHGARRERIGRLIVLVLARELGVLEAEELSEVYGLAGAASVRSLISRFSRRCRPGSEELYGLSQVRLQVLRMVPDTKRNS